MGTFYRSGKAQESMWCSCHRPMAEKVALSKHDSHRPYLGCKLVQKKLECHCCHCPYRHVNVSSFLQYRWQVLSERLGSQCYKFAKQVPKEVLEENFHGGEPDNLPELHRGIRK